MEKLVEIGQTMGLEGQDLLNFVTEQQNIQIKDAKAKREAEAARREADAEQQKIQIEEANAKREAEAEQKKRYK